MKKKLNFMHDFQFLTCLSNNASPALPTNGHIKTMEVNSLRLINPCN